MAVSYTHLDVYKRQEEYLIGEYAIAMIERKIGVTLPVDEAGFIALHIVNAEYNLSLIHIFFWNPALSDLWEGLSELH